MEIIDVTGIELPSLDKINKDIVINKDTYVPTDIFDYEVPLLLKDAEGKDFKWETLKKFAEKQQLKYERRIKNGTQQKRNYRSFKNHKRCLYR
ncbi:hypothetical protein [Megamonas funiformis]|uniref:hypothetical protein n=1 Tax=Megamonas funiformis TaxID=437897 RepID=UPI0022E8988C|nr:hypothetical protein [Megamonas funiformis]